MKVASFISMHYPDFQEKVQNYNFWRSLEEMDLILIPDVPMPIRIYDKMDFPIDEEAFVQEISALRPGFIPKAQYDMNKGAVSMINTPTVEELIHYIGPILFQVTDELWSTYRWRGEDLFWYIINNQLPETLIEDSLFITQHAIGGVIDVEHINNVLELYFNYPKNNYEDIDFAFSDIIEHRFQVRRDMYRFLVKKMISSPTDVFDAVMMSLDYYTREVDDG